MYMNLVLPEGAQKNWGGRGGGGGGGGGGCNPLMAICEN